MAELEEQVWLLQNALNPFPVAGRLALNRNRLVLTLDPMAKDAFTGWVEKALDDPAIKDKVERGETVTVFDTDVAGLDISWPKQFMGSGLKVAANGRDWLIALVYPSGNLYTTYKVLRHRGESKAWRQALETARAA